MNDLQNILNEETRCAGCSNYKDKFCEKKADIRVNSPAPPVSPLCFLNVCHLCP